MYINKKVYMNTLNTIINIIMLVQSAASESVSNRHFTLRRTLKDTASQSADDMYHIVIPHETEESR